MTPLLKTSEHAARLATEGFSVQLVMQILGDALRNMWRPTFAAWAMGLDPIKALRAGFATEAMLRSFVMLEVRRRITDGTWKEVDGQNASMLPSTDYAVDFVRGEDGVKILFGSTVRAAMIAPIMWWYGLDPTRAAAAAGISSALIESAVVQRVEERMVADVPAGEFIRSLGYSTSQVA